MYSPTGRVLTVFEILQSRPGITGPELADKLETDVRTIRRYISKLQDVGIQVEANPGRYGGYRLKPGYKLPPLVFSEEEATAVVLGLLASPWLAVELPKAAVTGAISKVTRVLSPEARSRLEALSSLMVLAADRSRPDASLLIRICEAVRTRSTLQIRYRAGDRVTDRVAEPYGLVGRAGYWYLIAYCRLRLDYRTFRLDRVESLEVREERFEHDDTFEYDRYVREHVETYPGSRTYRVLFEADIEAVRAAIPQADGPLTERPDGVEFEGRTDDFAYEIRRLLRLELPFSALEPQELKDAMNALARELRDGADGSRHPAAEQSGTPHTGTGTAEMPGFASETKTESGLTIISPDSGTAAEPP